MTASNSLAAVSRESQRLDGSYQVAWIKGVIFIGTMEPRDTLLPP
jgi:hypothetical protein